ncbi:hypothetical protein B0H13DRAFT_1861101 [Mycena leptocephala]|nr:hypothetical protein B0H13DRAFT_1861101 [Mycena leptocephala]
MGKKPAEILIPSGETTISGNEISLAGTLGRLRSSSSRTTTPSYSGIRGASTNADRLGASIRHTRSLARSLSTLCSASAERVRLGSGSGPFALNAEPEPENQDTSGILPNEKASPASERESYSPNPEKNLAFRFKKLLNLEPELRSVRSGSDQFLNQTLPPLLTLHLLEALDTLVDVHVVASAWKYSPPNEEKRIEKSVYEWTGVKKDKEPKGTTPTLRQIMISPITDDSPHAPA